MGDHNIARDVFISYRDDGEGRGLATMLYEHLDAAGYDVFYDKTEKHSGNFIEKLLTAVRGCKDFLLIVTNGCLEQLKRHDKVDWVREELLTARRSGKNILPLLAKGVSMPKNWEEMPEDLQFLPILDSFPMPDPFTDFLISPFAKMTAHFQSKAEKDNIYRNAYNTNPDYDVTQDYRRIRAEAEQGDVEAMYELANMSFYGIADANGDSQLDYAQAYHWLKELTKTDNPHRSYALKMLGHMYYQGIVPKHSQSYEKCFRLHEEAMKTSAGESHHIAYMQSIGSGCEFDFDRAVACYKIAVERGDNTAKMGLADFYMTYGRFREAAAVYQQVYNQLPQAAIKLGLMHKSGVLSDPPRPNYMMAAFYFQSAIQSNNCGAQAYLELGKLYFNPTGGFSKDFRKAQENFLIAADMGSAEAQYLLGYMFLNGHVTRSLERAAHYFELAYEHGDVGSAIQLATIYQQPEMRNYHKAFQYARAAAEAGFSSGAFIYANLLYLGRGCVADEDRACKYYRFALDHGFEQADFMLRKIEGDIDD